MEIISLDLDRETAMEIRAKWQRDLTELDAKRAVIVAKLQTLEEKLGVKSFPTLSSAKSGTAVPGAVSVYSNGVPLKAPRGENLRRVLAHLTEHGKSATGEIAKALELTASSVSSVLNHHPQHFFREADGLWILKPSTTEA